MSKKKRKDGGRSRGILLMEVIVALVVLSIGITAVMQAFFMINRLTRAAGNVFYAVVRLEKLLWEGEEHRDRLLGGGHAESSQSDVRGEYQTLVSLADANPAGLKEARMAVSWREPGRNEYYEFQTYFYIPPKEEEEE